MANNGIGWMSAGWVIVAFGTLVWGWVYTNFILMAGYVAATAFEQMTISSAIEIRAVKYIVFAIFCAVMAILSKRN